MIGDGLRQRGPSARRTELVGLRAHGHGRQACSELEKEVARRSGERTGYLPDDQLAAASGATHNVVGGGDEFAGTSCSRRSWRATPAAARSCRRKPRVKCSRSSARRASGCSRASTHRHGQRRVALADRHRRRRELDERGRAVARDGADESARRSAGRRSWSATSS